MNGVISYECELDHNTMLHKYFKVWREYAEEDGYFSNPKGESRIVMRKEITKEHYEHPIATEIEQCGF